MNDIDNDFYSSGQGPTTPASPAKDSNIRPHGDMLKMMNPTPNGFSPVTNHKPKPEGQDSVKHHESKNNSLDHHKHSSDHVKKKDDESKHKSSSHSKHKESSKDSKREGHEGHKDKERHSSSHKESSKSKESHKHSDHSNHSSEKTEEKHKSDSVKKEHHSSDGKPKIDNFKENEKVKDSSSKEHKEKHKDHKEKHKDKHKDKEHKEKHKDKEHKEKHRDKEHKEKHKDKEHKDKEKHKDKSSSSDKPKEKSEKPKEKSDKPKEKSDKPKDDIAEKHKDKERHKDKHGEKHKDKHSEKHKDKHGEKHKERKEKIKEEPVEKSLSPLKEPSPPKKVKDEPLSDDDIPLTARQASITTSKPIKREVEDSDDEPLSMRMEKKIKIEKIKKKKPTSEDEEYEEKPKKKRKVESDDDEYGAKKSVKKIKKEKQKAPAARIKTEPVQTASPKKKKKDEEEQEVWKWWEEEKLEDGIKWRTLQHYGPVFAPPYERVPKNVKFYYDGKHMELSELTEEVAGFYGRMLDHDYTSKEVFNNNFFKDWKKVMTPEEKEVIKDLRKCNFNCFNDYYKMKSEERKSMSKEEKLVIKKENEELTAKYGFCIIDGHKQKIGNFRIEPPGLFRGRGEHPKMGMLKRRVEAEDILINIGKEAEIPEPPPGHKWKEVRHDNTVSWLASWAENILGATKYIMLNPSSKLKGEKDWQKYETARKLKQHAGRIRDQYQRDFKSKEMKVRQRAVALYFIDKLALRAGNEKDEDTADTVGCCSLRVEHITLDDEKDGQEYVVSFDFLGKDSIRYQNSVAVEKRAYKNLKLFMENKQPADDLFDRLNTSILNKYLNDLMEGLTAKVFRTYNASKTLQEQLNLLTKEEMSIPEKILAYNRANRAVAILCNHQRAVPKGFDKSMENLKQKMDDKLSQIKEFKKELKQAKQAAKDGAGKDKQLFDKKKKRLAQLEDQYKKLEVQATDREENKQIALGTSKLNYLDPRISAAWCKKWNVPIEKIYNKTQRDKFRWAIEMAEPDFEF